MRVHLTQQEFAKEVHSVIELVSRELSNRQANIPGEGSVDELRDILQELYALERKARRGWVPWRCFRGLASTRIVSDTWELDGELARRIYDIADMYKRRVE